MGLFLSVRSGRISGGRRWLARALRREADERRARARASASRGDPVRVAARLAIGARCLAVREELRGGAGAREAQVPAMSALVRVAAAVILRSDGRCLLAQRPLGKPYAGYWEFPGGKLEPGEAPEHALARELYEELGLVV